MYKVQSGKTELIVEFDDSTCCTGTINGVPFEWQVTNLKENVVHVLKDHQSVNAEFIEVDPEQKKLAIKVNGTRYDLVMRDDMDQLLQKMGLDDVASKQVKEIKAPMPGLVLDVLVETGGEVCAGDPVMVLEAMKMENILKSPVDGLIKSIPVGQGAVVKKNETLINFQ